MDERARAVGRVVSRLEQSLAAGPLWMRCMARLGYASRGAMYFMTGGLALLAAVGAGGSISGVNGSLRRVLSEPLGEVVVVVVIFGLAGHAVWCFIQAALDPEWRMRIRCAPGQDGQARRAGYRVTRFFEGLVHVGLVAGAVGLMTGWRRPGHESSAERWTEWLMSWPSGIWLVGAAGAGAVGFGVFEVTRAWRVKLDAMLSFAGMGKWTRRAMITISRFGIAARGVVYSIIGGWLIAAARGANARAAKGLGAAMRDLHGRPYGRLLLGVAAVGLMAFGGYEMLRAGYRRIGKGRG
jgi:hypothetical protein